MDETITKDQAEDMAPETSVQEIQGDVALAKFYDVAELTGHDHAELVKLAGMMAVYFEPADTLSAHDVLAAVALRWWNTGKF